MSSYNEDIQELIIITKALHKEVKRLNTKIRTDRLTRILNCIPSKTVLYSGQQMKNIKSNTNDLDNNSRFIVKFNE